jgi:hypothetical protein
VTVGIPTTWDIRHTDAAFPDQVVIRVLGAGQPTIQILVFPRDVFLQFAEQIEQVATGIRQGLIHAQTIDRDTRGSR